mmetsp:Transcript_38151/g.96538  ORF Transcript_38151/g.96538 Transcript_38151/m.96538 type:complete len:213 (-) Transcript_38151:484-1122(-)
MDPDEAVQGGAEVPLVQLVVAGLAGVQVAHEPREGRPDRVEHGLAVPQQQHGRHAQAHLDEDPVGLLVELVADAQRRVHHDGVDGVHGADVVQHVRVAQHHARKEHEEVEAPHHLPKPAHAEVGRLVVVGEVAKARHPHVRGDEDADGVVHLLGLVVVVQQEQYLHPPLPLLRLLPDQQHGRLDGLHGRPDGHAREDDKQEDEEVAAVALAS